MALDTKQKRMSAALVGMPFRPAAVDPTETGFDQGSRKAAGLLYSGIASGGTTPVDIPLDSTYFVRTEHDEPLDSRYCVRRGDSVDLASQYCVRKRRLVTLGSQYCVLTEDQIDLDSTYFVRTGHDIDLDSQYCVRKKRQITLLSQYVVEGEEPTTDTVGKISGIANVSDIGEVA